MFYLQRLFFFLEPLSVLLPDKVSSESSLKGVRRDWNLPFLVSAYGLSLLAAVSYLADTRPIRAHRDVTRRHR
jgi:hypothetical protein